MDGWSLAVQILIDMKGIAWIGMMALICLALTIIPVNAMDYVVGENVTIFMQLMDQGSPIPDSTCLLTVFYPNRTVFMDDMQMDYMSDDGIFYYDLVAPESDGVYMTYVICNVSEPYPHNISCSGELHISIPESHCNYVGGTEYTPGDIGMVAIQVLKTAAGNPVPVADAVCTVDIYYPNTSLFIGNASSLYIPMSNGVYSYNFTVPGDLGVYMADFDCTYPPGSRKAYGSGTFHVAVNITKQLDFINITTWGTWLLLLNLTVGNVSVSADINYTELTAQVWNKSNQYKIQNDLLSLSDGVISTVVTTPVCRDNRTLVEMVNNTQCILGNCVTNEFNSSKICEYGCINNQCLPTPQQTSIYLFLFIVLFVGIIVTVYLVIRKWGQ